MKNIQLKNNLFKNIFYIFFALCFLSAGFLFLNFPKATNFASAEDVSSEHIENDVPEYFSAEEFIWDGTSTDHTNDNSIIDQNTFLYFRENSTENYLKLSLKKNKSKNENGILDYVYYPNQEDLSTFYFYHITNLGLSINGQNQILDPTKNFIQHTNYFFENHSSSITLDGFDMVFSSNGNGSNEFSIMEKDESGNPTNQVKEGVYTLSLTMLLFTCTDGNGAQENFLPGQPVTIEYSFYVLAQDSYITNNRPKISFGAFDSQVTNSASSTTTAYTLFSNYSSKPNASADEKNANQIPYIEYDYTRFELDIRKELSNDVKYTSLAFDKDFTTQPEISPIVTSGADIIKTDINVSKQTCRVYFTDVGTYTLNLKAIKLVVEDGKTMKYALDGVSLATRNVVVHLFGYQAGYTDFDKSPDSNNIRPISEMKEFENDANGNLIAKESADITSKFLNSNTNFSQDARNTTFTRRNIVNFLNTDKSGNIVNNPSSSTQYAHAPVKTNQTPVRFLSNANLVNASPDQSYILTTNRNMSGFAETSYTLHGQNLWEKAFTGQTENAEGTYIYVIAYTYKNHTNSTKVFYQVFFFEIEKGTPSISVTTLKEEKPDGTQIFEDIFSNTFTNKSVYVKDTTQGQPFNKDVVVQIYAWDYVTQTYMQAFGAESGRSLQQLAALESPHYLFQDDETLMLTANAKYTIRLYYNSDLQSESGTSTNISSTTGFCSEQEFTIDAIGIQNIVGRNVASTVTGYQMLNNMQSFSTNQNMSIAWDKKQSGARSYAFYRFFPLIKTQYYSTNENSVASLLGDMLTQGKGNAVLPVNSVLNLSSTAGNWIPLGGNTVTGGNTIDIRQNENLSSEYVLSQAGLYLVEICDDAGNSTMDVFLIDNTTPIFALYNGETSRYELISSTVYLNQTSTLYWADYKGIYISGLNSEIYTNIRYDDENPPTLSDLSAQYQNFYLDRNKNLSSEIYKTIYKKLYGQHMQFLTCANANAADITSELIPSYSAMYMTIKINDVSYYADNRTEGTYVYQHSSTTNNQKEFVVTDEEMNYRILIRDMSNTKMDLTLDETARAQYTNYFSARQTVRISFDPSKFTIRYSNGETQEELTPFLNKEGIFQNDTSKRTLTSYFNPTSLQQAFEVSFIPTTMDSDSSTKTQVESVSVAYYRYKYDYKEVDGLKYYYNTLSDSAETDLIYNVNDGESDKEFSRMLGISNIQKITNPGKYVITKTYKIDEGCTYNIKDYYQRIFVLIVDRNDVITPPETVDDGHAESLVGGDVFVAMFDNGISSNLYVTAPNSDKGNSDGKAIYDERLLLTTNKLPVNIYIPQFKYTTNVSTEKTYDRDGNETSYHFNVNYDFSQETIGDTTISKDTMNNFEDGLQIKEYSLFAQLFKGSTSNLIATTAFRNSTNPSIDDIGSDGNGFMKFYTLNGQEFGALTEVGIYYVKIFQGFGTEYQQATTFSFEIKSATPDFTAQLSNGSTLHSLPNTPTATNSYSEIYYTNSSEITLSWAASTDEYMVQIDVNEIDLLTNNGTRYSTHEGKYNTTSDIWTIKPYEQNNHTYLAQLNLEKLSGVYQNNGWVDITMQFENQDSEQKIYKPVTKRIYVDLSAPSNNINSLVAKSTSNTAISALNEGALRTYQTAKFQSTNDVQNTSYNISNSTGIFANYSYSVSQSYLETLKTSKDYLTYIREFSAGRYAQGEEETTPTNFSPNNFTEVSQLSGLEEGRYYEVVEVDRAGNMTIYTVYIASYSVNSNLISYEWTDSSTGENLKRSYTKENFDLVKGKSGAIHNIYSKTGFMLTDINFFGDEWAQITLTTFTPRGDRTTRTLMLTPYDKGYALMFVGNSTPERIAVSSLIDGSVGSVYKNCMSILNRDTATTENFYINIYNTSLSASLTERQEEEYIRFGKVSDEQINNTSRATAYLTQLSITAYDSANNRTIIYGSDEDSSLTGEGKNWLGYISEWKSNDRVSVDMSSALIFRLSDQLNFTPNSTRIVYRFVDNYGTVYNEVHIFRESIIEKEISSVEDLYSFNDKDGNLIYITQNGFQYIYNPSKIDVQAYSIISGQQTELLYAEDVRRNNPDGTQTYTVLTTRNTAYNDNYVLEITDHNNGNFIKRIYFMLYNQLPTAHEDNGAGRFWMLDGNGTDITDFILGNSTADAEYFSEVRIMYNLRETFIPVKFSISTDRINWTELSSGTRLRSSSDQIERYYLKIWYDQTYLPNQMGGQEYVFGKVPQIYEFNLSSLKATYWIEKTIDGTTSIVKKNNSIFQTPSGMQYTNHYLVDVDYSQRAAIAIKVNKEQNITSTRIETFVTGNVTSELWLISNDTNISTNVPAFETYIVISYIPASDNFVEEFYASNSQGVLENENLITKTALSVLIAPDSNVDRLQLQWSKYYGITQNEISIQIKLDGIKLSPTTYTKTNGDKQFNYTYLTYSGKYTISLKDTLGNIQKFNLGTIGQTENFSLTFLKDVPFTVTYNNVETGELETTLPIKQAVYNSAVTLDITESVRADFFSLGLSAYPTISVKRNGVDYDKNFSDNATSFTFEETGYYEISFSVSSNNSTEEALRKEVYQFTIINPNEHKISYVFNQYSNYYVEKVVKDGQDITQELISTLDVEKIWVGGNQYLMQLPLSYLDGKTGVGTYLITINSNNQLFKNLNTVENTKTKLESCWTYIVKINRGTAPLEISLSEGSSTTKTISVRFNQENVFAEMGECSLNVVRQNGNTFSIINSTNINADSTGEGSAEITQDGTFFIQIVSPSGTLLFSYKVTKKAPMNAASIIAIVISAIVLVVVIFIIFKLRKRISVK